MLFNSFPFLAFLAVALAGLAGARALAGARGATAWLLVASLVFYGWGGGAFLVLLLGSIAVNAALGLRLGGLAARGASRQPWLAIGIGFNLALLGWFKYRGFLLASGASLGGEPFDPPTLVLPLAISFFTFQQIAYLVDIARGEAPERTPWRYALFVAFFPQLIAGPIVHPREMLPQLRRADFGRLRWANLAPGLSLFCIGLFKKVILADGIEPYVSAVYDAALVPGAEISFLRAWLAAGGFGLQIYFDFSAYSDMATGLARMVGIALPINFNSPYRATSIIEFWRRWHITLSRFLRDYLYFPLGGNRRGRARRYANLMIVMLLGGLWHGAGWNFVLWGGLHGLYLVANHAWRFVRRGASGATGRAGEAGSPGTLGRAAGWALTLVAVMAAWVPFRAESTGATVRIWEGLVLLHGVGPPDLDDLHRWAALPWLAVGLAICVALPNALQWVAHEPPEGPVPEPLRWPALAWAPSARWAVAVGLLAAAAIVGLGATSEFLYFEF